MPEKIIIDTDPGQDDAVAILMALASPDELEVLGISTVAGNIGLAQNTINALKVVELAGQTGIPVYAGSPAPLRRPLVTAEHVHGQTGLDGPVLPDPQKQIEPGHGADFIIDTLRAEPEKTVTLVALGPLTNVALALIKAPDIGPHIKQIILMGGAYFEVGNLTPAAEFNIYVDPEAADVVMRSGVPITMASLDVTHKVLTTHERIAALRAIGNASGAAVADMLSFSERFDLAKYGWNGAPLHDPCTIAFLLKPELFEGRQINVSIEVQSELTRGMTVADFWQITDKPRNVFFLSGVDADGFYALLIGAVGAAAIASTFRKSGYRFSGSNRRPLRTYTSRSTKGAGALSPPPPVRVSPASAPPNVTACPDCRLGSRSPGLVSSSALRSILPRRASSCLLFDRVVLRIGRIDAALGEARVVAAVA